MKIRIRQTVSLFALAVLSIPLLTAASAAGQDACNPAPPQGLKKGDLYYVAFVTRNERDAKDTDIDKYNQFVNDQASNACARALFFTYHAVASTAQTSAKNNLQLKVIPPIYRVDGKRVVEHAENLFGGLGLDNPINIDEARNSINGHTTWTGTNWKDGSALGDGALGSGAPGTGDPQQSDQKFWIQRGRTGNDQLAPMYAISDLLKVP